MKSVGISAIAAIGVVLTLGAAASADSPGDTVGMTQYELQAYASAGNRISIDPNGGVHVAWMKGFNYNNTRGVAYDYRPPSGQWSGGEFIDQRGSGYPSLALATDGRAVIAYHRPQTGAESLYCAVDAGIGFGTFDVFLMPARLGSIPLIWPQIASDRQGRMHVVATQPAPTGSLGPIGYTRSSDNGVTWQNLQTVDSVYYPSAVITASRVSDKVAIVYCHPFGSTGGLQNDIYYIQSTDGNTWDFIDGKINVTYYARRPDSSAAFIDCDAVYDYNDDLHIIWTENVLGGDGNLENLVMVVHYSISLDVITPVYFTGTSWPNSGCQIQSNDRQICKISLGVEQTFNTLFTVYTRFDSTDCAARGDANGDIYMQLSANNGHCWSIPYNLTNSHTPGCNAGDCDSDHWASLAEVVDDHLHILYVNDKEAGFYPQEERAGDDIASITDNPVLYLAIPNPLILSVDDNPGLPEGFTLRQNYPNPFNAETRIGFDLAHAGRIRLEIFDITGASVATLIDRHFGAGRHEATWEAGALASGTYFYKLTTAAGSQIRRMTLLK